MSRAMIVIPALHPARELLVRVDALRPGAVHRAVGTIETVGGKPINVARFVRLMGGDVRLIARVDPHLRDALLADPVLGAGPDVELIATRVPSRTDVTVIDAQGATTPINGTAPPAPAADVDHGAPEAGPRGLQPAIEQPPSIGPTFHAPGGGRGPVPARPRSGRPRRR